MTQRNTRILKENTVAYMLTTPQLLFFGLSLVYLVIEGFRLSMFDASFLDEILCGLDNCRSLFTDLTFYKAAGDTLVIVLWTTVITAGAGFFVSPSVFDKRMGYITLIRGSYYIPTTISMVVYGAIWEWMLNPPFGIVYYIPGKFGIHDPNLLEDYRYVLHVLILLICVMNVGQAIVSYVAAMQGINKTLMELARINGASRVGILKSTVYPLVKSTTLYLVVINIIGMMKIFAIVNVMISGGPNYASSPLVHLCHTEAFRSFNQSRVFAIGVVMFLVTFMISLVPSELFRRKGQVKMKERKGSFDFINNCLVMAGAAISYFPPYWLLSSSPKYSHTTNNMVSEWFPKHPTPQNYVDLFSNSDTLRWLFNSAFISAVTTVLIVLTSVLATYASAKVQLKGKKVLFVLSIVTLILPKEVHITPPFKVTQKLGTSGGYVGATLPNMTLSSGIFLLGQYFESILDALREAARMDGASEWYIPSGIYVPLIKAGIAALIILVFIQVWNDYLWQLIQLTRDELEIIQPGVASTQNEQNPDPDLTMAGAVYAVLPLRIMSLVFQNYFTQSITMGVVKEQRERKKKMNILKEKLKNHEPLAGAHVILTDPCISEIISSLDYDLIWIDTEHSVIDYRTLEMHLMTVRAGGTPAVVRVSWNDPTLVKCVSEQGPDGIVFPVIDTAEEARQAMENCLYLPEGKRGLGSIRAAKYGLEDMDGYIRTGRKELCRLIQIGSKEGVRNLDEILCNPYIDGVIIGARDLSDSIGILNQVFDERSSKLTDEAVQTVGRHQVPIGIFTGSTDPETLKFWYDGRLTILPSGMDYFYILSGARQILDTTRTVFGSPPHA